MEGSAAIGGHLAAKKRKSPKQRRRPTTLGRSAVRLVQVAVCNVGLSVTIGDWVSVVGLAIVFVQIWRTGRIAKATKSAVDEATKRVGVYN